MGELSELYARLGRFEKLEPLFLETQDRPVGGTAQEKLTASRQGLAIMQQKPGDAFRCGPYAVERILALRKPDYREHPKIAAMESTPRGTSLAQMHDLAKDVGLAMQMARRVADVEFLLPAMVHWKAGHFAALTRKEGERYLVEDPTFGSEIWVGREALNTEASGYSLVPQGRLPQGWSEVREEEGKGVWGKGTVSGGNPPQYTPEERKFCPRPCPGCRMAFVRPER